MPEPPPDAEVERILEEGLRLWNAHRFFECHDKLEEAWKLVKFEKKVERAKDPRRDFFQGLILYAVAYVHWQKGNRVGVERKRDEAHRLWEGYAGKFLGIDVDGIRAAVEEDLSRGVSGAAYDDGRVPILHRTLTPSSGP